MDKDWTKGSILKNLLMISWPIIISQSLNMIGPTIDMIWVGKLGTAEIAGVGIAGMIVMFINAAMMGISVGIRALIARYIGARNPKGANNVAKHSFIIAACFSGIIIIAGIFFSEHILALFGVEPDVIIHGTAYLRIMFIASAAMTFRMMTEGIMQSSGDVKTPMKISILFRIVHVILCPFLVYGVWIFPNLGVKGAAISNVFSHCIGLILGVWVLFSGRTRLRLKLNNFIFDMRIIKRIIKIGIPAIVMRMQLNFLHIVMAFFMIQYGTTAIAGHVIVQRIDMILKMIIVGLGVGTGVLVGQNLGAQKKKQAEKTGWLALGLAEGIMVIISIVLLIWPEFLVKIFSTEPELVALTSSFLRIAVVGYLVFSFIAIPKHCLTGAGDTIPAMIIELAHVFLVMIPFAYILTKFTNLGVYGVRWAIVIGMSAGGLAYFFYFLTGKWKHKKV